MIKKAQTRFICTTVAILLVVFSVIFGITTYFQKSATVKTTYSILDDVIKVYQKNDLELIQPKCGACIFYGYNSDGTAIIGSPKFDSEEYTLTKLNSLVFQFAKQNITTSKMGNYVFKKINYGSNYIIAVLNASNFFKVYTSNTIKLALALSAILIVLSLIVWGFSFKVLEPVKEAFFRQQTFVSNASHELKTPLSVISANAFVLQNQSDNQWINNIKTQTEKMDTLIKDMLSLAKIDEGRFALNIEEINLSDEIIAISLPFEEVAFEKGKMLNLSIPNNIKIKGDRQSLKQIVNILIENAVKYGEKGGAINIVLKNEGKPTLTVYNDGNNVPPEDKDKIFERFYRSDDSRSRGTGGSGLGLAIAKSLCQVNKWKISAKPILNKSMTITVIF